jgi:ketosteroid isomerase-like protein
VEVSKAGDLAYSQGAYTATMTNPKTKKVVTETGKFVTVYKKQPIGAWKAVADIFNADGPVAPAKHRASPAPAPHKHHKSTARKR